MLDTAVEIVAELRRILHRTPRLRRLCQVFVALLLGVVAWKGVAWVLRPGVAVSGRITFNGEPLEQGLIAFHQKLEGGNGPTLAGAAIEGGRYEVAADAGLVPGKYVVHIHSTEAAATTGDDGTSPPGTERIPASFNERSVLIIEVSRFGLNRFDFTIP